MKKLILLSLFVFAAVSPLLAADEKVLVNVDQHGLALQGYDPVAFFTQHKPVKGSAQFQGTYGTATYYFASTEDQAAFAKDPAKYAPQFGGFCAYGVAHGKTVPIEVDAFQIVDGRLLMQYDQDIRDSFNEDTQGNFLLAEKKWPTLVEQDGKAAK
ncbi:MAG: YHS domain-containing (seleno)protein [Opitutales bacterium]|jgi:YHS domain-containing protein